MAAAGQAEYHVFASLAAFGKSLIDGVGTIEEYRGGQWYRGKLLEAPVMASTFGSAGTGMQRAADVTLRIADPPDGTYRAFANAGTLGGTTATVTAVMRMRAANGTVSEVTQTQQLTIAGVSLKPGEVQIKLTDLESTKFNTLYPPLVWSADDWPSINDGYAGKPICYPVGTALKVPCPQLVSDDAALQYVFGVCTSVPYLIAISSIVSAPKRVTLAQSASDLVEVGQTICITGSSAADGAYTIATILSGTSFTVNEALPASNGGSVRLMPHVRTVYRAGRVVDPSEYTVIHIAARGPLVNGNFDTGTFLGWTLATTGSGNGSAATMQASLTANGAGNSAVLSQTIAASKGLWRGVAVTVSAASTVDATVNGAHIDAYRTAPRGKRTGLLFRETATGAADNLSLNPYGGAGTIVFDNVSTIAVDLVAVLFALPQLDFQGGAYAIEADIRGIESRNAADEVKRLLTAIGVTPDTASFANARGIAAGNLMNVDCDYGRAGQRAVRAIIDDHLFLLRAALYRDDDGGYAIAQDSAGAPSASLDDSLGDSVSVDGIDWDERPTSVSLRYRPGSRDPGTLQNTIKRAVSGGLLGDESPRDCPYIRDHETADRLLCYLAERRSANGKCSATVYRQQFSLTDVVTLGSPLNWGATPRTWSVRGVQRTPNANKLDLIEYDAQCYVYTPTVPLPGDASGTGYQPDYSQTPPAAPTALTITNAAVALAPDGTSSAWVAVRCVPPPVNATQVWFTATHNVTGEIIRAQGTIAGGFATVTLSGLRAGNVYKLSAYAVNSFNVQGAMQSMFNATAIGGGAAVTTFNAPGYATAPPNVGSISALQGTGLIVQVAWPVVSLPSDVLGDYLLERSVGGAGYAEVWRGRANGYTDRDFSVYNGTVAYRVRASDRWGNVSAAYATSSTLTLTRTIYGGSGNGSDINDNTVTPGNRSGVTTASATYNYVAFTGQPSSGRAATVTINHSLGKVPIVASMTSTGTQSIAMLSGRSSSSVTVSIYRVMIAQTEAPNPAAGGQGHVHAMSHYGDSGTVAVDVW